MLFGIFMQLLCLESISESDLIGRMHSWGCLFFMGSHVCTTQWV